MFSSNTNFPTDNIYKFFAIFGIVLMIVGYSLFNSTYNNFNEDLFEYTIKLSKLEMIEKPNPYEETQIKAFEKRLQLLKDNKSFNRFFPVFSFILGLTLMFYGFIRWQFFLQPKLDELLDLQLKEARANVRKNKKLNFKL